MKVGGGDVCLCTWSLLWRSFSQWPCLCDVPLLLESRRGCPPSRPKERSLAKRGAEAALQRIFALSAEKAVGLQVAHHDDGPLGAPDAAPFDFGLPNQMGVDGEGM